MSLFQLNFLKDPYVIKLVKGGKVALAQTFNCSSPIFVFG